MDQVTAVAVEQDTATRTSRTQIIDDLFILPASENVICTWDASQQFRVESVIDKDLLTTPHFSSIFNYTGLIEECQGQIKGTKGV
jgi:hypothetical protein